MSIEERLVAWLREGLRTAAPVLHLAGDLPEPELLTPKSKEHGDFSTNVALTLAKPAGRAPREVAQAIVDALSPAPFVEKVEIAGPGFLNIFTTDEWLHDAVREIVNRGSDYGRAEPTGERIQVEFVSANPTGPLTLGHARNAAIGDALARLLETAGHTVEREYYFNDAGTQMDRFGRSVEASYLQACGRPDEVPEDGYHGDYIAELAADILADEGTGLAELEPQERFLRLRGEGARRVLGWIKATLQRFGVTFDDFFSETTLADGGEIGAAIERMRASGHVYEDDGAVWFRSTDFGDDKDRVLIRSSGEHTYFAADCAYLADKFDRGFDHMIYVWGADHHGDVVRVKGAARAMGYEPEALEMLIYQWVAFLRDGEPVPMGKRSGNFITLDQLIDEVGTDAARFHLLMFSNDSTMNFDIEAVKRQTMDNPVYYVQYGHARIASLLRKAEERGIERKPVEDADLTRLTTDPELELLRALADVPGQLADAASRRAPNRCTQIAQDLARSFHRFYTECPVLSDDDGLTQARLWLSSATKQVIADLLALLGVSAPETMEREDG